MFYSVAACEALAFIHAALQGRCRQRQYHAMADEFSHDIVDARSLCRDLRDLFESLEPGQDDAANLEEVQRLCEMALLTIDDSFCQKQMREVERYASYLFSSIERPHWDRGATPGAVFLRELILRILAAFDRRLLHLETMRRFEAKMVLPQPRQVERRANVRT